MTKAELLRDDKSESREVRDALLSSWKHADSLRVSGSSVASTFQWLHANRVKPILLLDYDVICAAVPSLVRNHVSTGPKPQADILSISEFTGPMMLRYILQRVEECIVPPGATAELLLGLERLRQNLSVRAKDFVERIRSVLGLENPTEILSASWHGREKDLLLEDLTRFEEDLQDQRTLQNILSRAVPVESLLHDPANRNDRDMDAFRGSYGFLASQRPGLSISNINDALNAAVVVRLFNNSPQQQARRIPVLISNTRAVRELNRVSESYLHQLGRAQERPLLFNDMLFLVIGQGLLERTQDRYGVAADAAAQLARDASALETGCLDLLEDQQNMHIHSDAFHMLLWRRSEFERKWGAILAPASLAVKRDRDASLRVLLSQAKGASSDESTRAITRELSSQISDIGAVTAGASALWDLIVMRGGAESSAGRGPSAFNYYLCDNDGELLRNVSKNLPLMEAGPISSLDEAHNLRIVMGPVYLSAGIVLSVASFLNPDISPRRYLSFTWLHGAGPKTIVDELSRLFRAHLPLDASVEVSLFDERQRVDARGALDASLATVQEILQPAQPEAHEGPHFFQIRSEGASVCADLQMIENLEMQANITFRAEDLSAKIYSELIGCMARTIEIGVPADYLRKVLEPVSQILSFKEK